MLGVGKKRLLAVGSSLLLSFLLAEAVARWTVGAPMRERLPLMMVRANPHRGWEMVPGLEHYTYQHRVHVNALGLRGPELGARASGERRVLFLGDSLTYGQGVADDETVPVALERALNHAAASGERWTVVNGGNRAYGTAQEVGLMEELGPAVEPDLVLLGWYWNDVSERPIEPTYRAFLARGEFAFDTNDDLAGWSRVRWWLEQLPRASAFLMLAHDLVSSKGKVYAPEVAQEGFHRLEELLVRFREGARSLGARPVVVIFPDAHRLEGGGATRSYDERCAGLARERELPLIELLPALQGVHATRGRLPILPFDGHYDADANRAMGAYLAHELARLGLTEPAR